MSNPGEEPDPTENLPEPLIQQIDSLQLPELKTVLSYVENRIETLRTPIEEEIAATTGGEVVNVESHGGYAFVQKHPPDPDGPGVNTDTVSLYHVRLEPHMDGTESLHWAYLGDVGNSEEIRCNSCGGRLDRSASVCPHCGSENVHQSGAGE